MAVPAFMQKYMKENKATLAAEEKNSGVIKEWIDSGCYIFNALLSADIYKGFASNKVTCIAGEKATGKSWYCMQAVKAFLDKYKDGICIYYDSESTLSKQMLDDRGIDSDRVIIDEVITIEEFRTKAKNFLNNYEETPKKERVPVIMVLDSLGQLASEAEVSNAAEGKNVRDMQKQQIMKSALRVATVQAGKLDIPIFITAHTYKEMGLFPKTIVAGGEALQYAASSIIMLSKSQIKEGTEKVGNFITCTAYKSRFTKEGTKVQTELRFDTGLNRYYGLLDIAVKCGICKCIAKKYVFNDDEKPKTEKQIYSNPEQYFTKDVLDKINEYVKVAFSYGSSASAFNYDENESVENESDENTENEIENIE